MAQNTWPVTADLATDASNSTAQTTRHPTEHNNYAAALNYLGRGGRCHDVTAYGAVGDGTTNDQPAFAAALSAASHGDTILVPAPATAFRLDDPWTIDKRVTVQCEPTGHWDSSAQGGAWGAAGKSHKATFRAGGSWSAGEALIDINTQMVKIWHASVDMNNLAPVGIRLRGKQSMLYYPVVGNPPANGTCIKVTNFATSANAQDANIIRPSVSGGAKSGVVGIYVADENAVGGNANNISTDGIIDMPQVTACPGGGISIAKGGWRITGGHLTNASGDGPVLILDSAENFGIVGTYLDTCSAPRILIKSGGAKNSSIIGCHFEDGGADSNWSWDATNWGTERQCMIGVESNTGFVSVVGCSIHADSDSSPYSAIIHKRSGFSADMFTIVGCNGNFTQPYSSAASNPELDYVAAANQMRTASGKKPAPNMVGDGVQMLTGSGTPEGAVTARVGSLYLRTDGSTSTTLYVKTSGTGNTGWTAK